MAADDADRTMQLISPRRTQSWAKSYKDRAAALETQPAAGTNFEVFPDSTTRNTLRWIKLATTESTRRKRIEEAKARALQNERVPNA